MKKLAIANTLDILLDSILVAASLAWIIEYKVDIKFVLMTALLCVSLLSLVNDLDILFTKKEK